MKTVHIAPGNPDSHQDGTALWPYRVHTATHFDSILKFHRGPTIFLLAPGAYSTRGAWHFDSYGYASIGPNSSLIGTHGAEATFLYLDPDYVSIVGGQPATYVETFIGGGRDAEGSEQMCISGLTLDLSAATLPVSGIHAYSSGCKITDVRVVGVSGQWGGPEGFGILVNDGLNSRGGGSIIVSCRVELSSPGNYVTGIYLGSTTPRSRPNIIEACYCSAPIPSDPSVKRAHASFSANENTTLSSCVSKGFDRFLFCDTGNVGDLNILACRSEYSYCAIDLPAPASENNPIAYRRNIRVSNSTFDNVSPSADHAIGILLQDMTPDYRAVSLLDVDVTGCRFSSALPPSSFYACSIRGLLTERVWIRQSQFPAGCKTRDGIYSPTPQASVIIEDVPAGEG